MAIKYLNTASGHGITHECDTMEEANGMKGNIYPGQLLTVNGQVYVMSSKRQLQYGAGSFTVDGFTFDPANMAVVDGDGGNDATAGLGEGIFKTVGAAAVAANEAYQIDNQRKICVYVRAVNSLYELSDNGLDTYPGIHYYFEPKAITSGNNGIGDFTYGFGNYWIHGKGEHYTSAGVFNCMAWSYGSSVFLDAAIVHNVNTLQNFTALPYARVTMTCNVDEILTAGNWQGDAGDLGGGNIEFNDCKFLGGIAINNFWQDKMTHTFNRCRFLMNSPVFNPIDGKYTAYFKNGEAALVIDMVNGGNGAPRGSRLYDFPAALDLQEVVDEPSAANVRTAVVDIQVSSATNGSGRETNLRFVDCQFVVDADKSVAFKVDQVNDCLAHAGLKLIRPVFIDISGGVETSAVVAFKDSTVTTEIPITIEDPLYSTVNYRSSNSLVATTKPDITIT